MAAPSESVPAPAPPSWTPPLVEQYETRPEVTAYAHDGSR